MENSQLATVVGTTAGVLTVFNLFPQYLQVMKTKHTKHTKDLSKATFISITISTFLWIGYGVLRSDLVLVFANSPVFFFSASILYVKVKYAATGNL